jgi:hypothetical protein
MRQYKYLTPAQKKQILEMSATHYVKDIAAIVGCDKRTVLNYQLNPANGVKNPKRKIVYRRKTSELTETDGYFDIKAWAKEMAF